MKRTTGLKRGKWRTSKYVKAKRAKRKTFEDRWRRWQLECYGEFIWGVIDSVTLRRVIGVAMPCERCGKSRAVIEVDHAEIPRSNRLRGDPWAPTNGQILDHHCNSAKGLSHGPEWDFRTTERKKHQEEKALKDWKKRRTDWEYIGSSEFVLKGGKYGED